jgi:hypothetical protein
MRLSEFEFFGSLSSLGVASARGSRKFCIVLAMRSTRFEHSRSCNFREPV